MADPLKRQALDRAARLLNVSRGMEGIPADPGESPVPVIPTGFCGIDHALGIGGIPRGRITEIFGGPSSGKTTLVLQLMARCQRDGGLTALIDTEHAFDPDYARALGVSTSEVYFSQPTLGEEALQIAERLVTTGALDMVVIDSAAALLPRQEKDCRLSDPGADAAQARMMSTCLRRLNAALARSQTALIFVNQLRTRLQPAGMCGSPDITTGGMALAFYATLRMELRQLHLLQDAGECKGLRVQLTVRKNKLAQPFTRTELDCRFGSGFDAMTDLVDQGLETGVLQQEGDRIRRGSLRVPGREAMADRLRQDPDGAESLLKAILQRRKRYGSQPLLCEPQLMQNDITRGTPARDSLPEQPCEAAVKAR